MSVTGEFRRAVADCVVVLEGSRAEGARRRADALRAAAALASTDLTQAAEHVLALADGGARFAPIDFATRAEREEFEHLWDHAMAIARVIVGRSEV